MKCHAQIGKSECRGWLAKTLHAGAKCTQSRNTKDGRPCGGQAVAQSADCGGLHCSKHIPSRNLYDRSIKNP
mgnify:CR=1 FL=1